MADIRITETLLKIDNFFVDGDTRTITLKNPKADISTEEIADLDLFLKTRNAIIGDRDGATFGKIRTVTRQTNQKTKLDIS